jgi:hypothetical protein
MSKKNHSPGPVPPGNLSPMGTNHADADDQQPGDQHGTGFQEEDPKRRLGDFTGAGEHARQQPGPDGKK